MPRSSLIRHFLLIISLGNFACSSNSAEPQGGTGQSSGGSSSSGGTASGRSSETTAATGGRSAASGGQSATGGTSAISASSATGGQSTVVNSSATGGKTAVTNSATGGKSATSSSAVGGSSTSATGGAGTGGLTGNGGTTAATGGVGTNTGSSSKTGGTGSTSGGSSSTTAGGVPGAGGMGGSAAVGGQSSSTTSTGGSSGGSTAFNPCKASPCVILPLGDSITHGFNSSDDGGYRTALFKLVVAANQNVTFIGSLSNGPGTVSLKTFPKNHEGHDGISVSGITGYVPPSKAFSTTPHIVLLHIGTNDMTSNADPTTTANQLDTLITNVVTAAPDALVVVAKIVPLGYSNNNYNTYIAKIPDVVKAHAAKNQHVIMVDMSTLPSSDIRGNGNVHPTDKGYSDMADLWYGVIKGYLPQ